MNALHKKPKVNFPEDDIYWQEVKNFLTERIVAHNPATANLHILAPIEFYKYFGNVLPYNFSYSKQISCFSMVVVHKGELEYIQGDFLNEVCNQYHLVFANPVFVVYSQAELENTMVETKHCNIKIPIFPKKQTKKIRIIALVNANQFGNLGDDAIIWSSYDLLHNVFPKAKINIYSPPIEKKDIFHADLLVLGGGGIFYDGCIYNTMNYTRYLAWAKEANIPCCCLGIGTQGINTNIGSEIYKEILGYCDFISVRDQGDFEVLKHKLALTTPIHVTQDMAFCLTRYSGKGVHILEGSKPKLFFSLLDSDHLLVSKKLSTYKETAISLLKSLQHRFDLWCLIQSEDDVNMYLESIDERRFIRIPFHDIGQVFHAYRQADVVLTSRFHGYIFSLMNRIPVIATGTKGGKIDRLISNFLPSLKNTFIQIDDFNEKLVDQKLDAIQKDPADFQIDVKQLSECIASARMNKELLEYYYAKFK